MAKRPNSKEIEQLVARNNKILDSIAPLLQTINDIGNTPEINVAVSSMFQSITGGVNQLGIKPLQQLLQQVTQLFSEQRDGTIQDSSYIELLNKSCSVIRESMNHIQKNLDYPQVHKSVQTLLKDFDLFHEKAKNSEAGKDESESEKAFDSFTDDSENDGGSFDSFADDDGENDDVFGGFGADDTEDDGGSFDSFTDDDGENDDVFGGFGADDTEDDGGSFDSFADDDSGDAMETADEDEGRGFLKDLPIQKPDLFIQKTVEYFQKLEHKLVSGSVVNDVWGIKETSQKKISQVVSEDGLVFDEPSIKQGLILCQGIQNFLSSMLAPEQLQLLKSIFPFYRSPQELLDYIKILFSGDIVSKEQSIRIYASKIIGTYNVIHLIRKSPKVFDGFANDNAEGFQKELQDYAEVPLKRIKNLLPRNMQEPYTWNRQTLKSNICKVLATREAMFSEKHNRSLIVERFREFVFYLMCDPGIFHYLAWKHQYLKYWLYTELYEIDNRNLASGKAKKPQYALAKLAAYQKLGAIFSTLEGDDCSFDKSKQLDKKAYESFRKSENYRPPLDPFETADMLGEEREKEKALLDSLSIAQLATLAENVHQGIAAMQSQGVLKGEIPEAMKIRSIEMGNHAKMEMAIQASVLKVQWTETKKISKKLSEMAFATLKKVSGKLNTTSKKAPQSVKKTAPKKIEGGRPLPRAEVEWPGFGKEVRSEIYTPQMPSLQITFFEHKRYELFLYPSFQEFIKQTMKFYKGHRYLQRVERPYVDGQVKAQHVDEAIYLKVKDGSVIAFGETYFKRPNEATLYFQVFHKEPVSPVEGKTTEWFNRNIDGSAYCMESFETPNMIRPILFRYLISVIESLPDDMKHHESIQSLHEGLRSFAEIEGELSDL
ncbi:MAG: hypothetical protein HQM14_15635 [SAR324 cluster bacterium]|nr:hypothetical protein [SAR324 cluster bacterium]